MKRILPLLLLLPCILLATLPRGVSSNVGHLATFDSDTLRMHDFTYPQRQAWDSATKVWYEEQYFAGCLKRYGFKLNCTDCTNLGVELQLEVDSVGTITAWKELSAKIYCHRHSLVQEQKVKDCILQSFPKLTLPAHFFGKVLIVYVGRVPAC